MIIVAGTVRIDPAKLEAFRPIAERMLAATRAEAGCVTYTYAFDFDDPALIRIYEEWDSREHLDAHLEAPHVGPFLEALGELVVGPSEINTIEGEPRKLSV